MLGGAVFGGVLATAFWLLLFSTVPEMAGWLRNLRLATVTWCHERIQRWLEKRRTT